MYNEMLRKEKEKAICVSNSKVFFKYQPYQPSQPTNHGDERGDHGQLQLGDKDEERMKRLREEVKKELKAEEEERKKKAKRIKVKCIMYW